MIKLLVVDDESVTRKGIMKYINWSELGVHHVEEAKDGIEGLEIAKEFKPNIVISDIKMPGMNGIEFATALRLLFPETRLIFLSGYSDKEYLKAAIHLNVVSYVEKPLDLEELRNAIKKAVTLHIEDDNKNSVLTGSLPLIKQNIVYKLIGRNFSVEELSKDLQLSGFPYNYDEQYTVLILKPSLRTDYLNNTMEQNSNDFFSNLEVCLSDKKHLIAEKDDNYIVIISCRNATVLHKDLYSFFETLVAGLKENNSVYQDVFCAVGSTVKEMVDIHKSYEAAVLTLQKLFYQGYGKIVFYENKQLDFISFEQNLTVDFMNLIQKQEKDKAIEFIENLCRRIRLNQGTLIDSIKSVFFKFALTLFQESEKRGLHLINTADIKEKYFLDIISNFETLQEMKEFIINKLNLVFDGIKELESNSRAVYNAINYIRNNYCAPDLSVKTLAENVYLTPTYLSALFKKETGITISDYIIKVRIEKSKELLIDPQIKLFEVAKRIGYNDANYYSKVFRKLTGMTPSAFREKYIS